MSSATTSTIDQPDWASILAVTLGTAAFGIALGLTYPLISLILAARGYGETVIGLNAAAFAFGLVAATLLLPRLTRAVAPARLIIAGLAVSAAVIMGFALIPWLAAWFLLRFALGFAINLVFIIGEAWLNAACPDAIRGRVTAIYTAAVATGFAAGPLGVPLFGRESGFGFAACAALVALALVGFALLSRRARVRPAAAAGGSLLIFARLAPLLVLMVLVFGWIDAVVIALFPVYFVDQGLSEGLAATTVTVLFCGVLGTMPLVGLALDRMDRRLVAIGCGVVAAAAAAGLIPVAADGLLVWPLLFILGGAACGLYTCGLTGLGERFQGGMLVAGSAMFALAYAIGGIFGPSVAGALMEATGPKAVPLSLVAILLIMVALLASARRSRT